jgi:hypothetical protein
LVAADAGTRTKASKREFEALPVRTIRQALAWRSRVALDKCHAPDRDHEAKRARHLHRHARRRFAGKELCVELVQLGEIARVGNEDGGVDDELGPAMARAKHRVEIMERLPCLLAERRTDGSCGLGIPPLLAGDEEEIACPNGR